MKIKLSNEYYIETVPLNYVLHRAYISYGEGKNADSKPRMVDKVCGYYISVEAALGGYVRQLAFDKTEDFEGNLEEYIARIKQILDSATKEFERLVNKNG